MRHRAEGSELELGNVHTPNREPTKSGSFKNYLIFYTVFCSGEIGYPTKALANPI